jgi:hypothetical protein
MVKFPEYLGNPSQAVQAQAVSRWPVNAEPDFDPSSCDLFVDKLAL